MKTTYEVKERQFGFIIEIKTAINGFIYRIESNDMQNFITVSTVDGSMKIEPSVSNQVKIKTNFTS